jgi:hypothetical protein
MYGDLSGFEYTPPSLMISEIGLTDDQLSILSEVSVFQITPDSSSYEKDLYTYVESAKLVVLNIPPGIIEIRLFESQNSPDPVQVINLYNIISNSEKVNKLLMFVSSSQSLDNLSPLIHEHSLKPHEGIELYVLTYDKLKEILSKKVITDEFVHTPSNVKLGDSVVNYEITFPKSVMVVNNKLCILE